MHHICIFHFGRYAQRVFQSDYPNLSPPAVHESSMCSISSLVVGIIISSFVVILIVMWKMSL